MPCGKESAFLCQEKEKARDKHGQNGFSHGSGDIPPRPPPGTARRQEGDPCHAQIVLTHMKKRADTYKEEEI